MANRTVKDAHSVKGTNPQYLVEKIIRTRIYECKYWKEECFALTGDDSNKLSFIIRAVEISFLSHSVTLTVTVTVPVFCQTNIVLIIKL